MTLSHHASLISLPVIISFLSDQSCGSEKMARSPPEHGSSIAFIIFSLLTLEGILYELVVQQPLLKQDFHCT
jgi:hypothetical protein